MTTSERLDRLEKAHRALSAQHLALQTVCRVLLPLIACPAEQKKTLIHCAKQVAEQEMRRTAADKEFRTMVSNWIDVIAGEAA